MNTGCSDGWYGFGGLYQIIEKYAKKRKIKYDYSR